MRQIRVIEDDGTTLTMPLDCVELGDGLYRIAEIPCPSEKLNYGDEFKGEHRGDILHVLDVVERAGYSTECFVMGPTTRSSTAVATLCEKVVAEQGQWVWFCGMLVVSLPPGSTLNAHAILGIEAA